MTIERLLARETSEDLKIMAHELEKPVYTVEPGRNIYRNGEPFIKIDKTGQTFPFEADMITRQICGLLNAREKENA